MTHHIQKVAIVSLMLLGWLAVGCVSSPSMQPADPLTPSGMPQIGPPLPSDKDDPGNSVALAYDPGDGSLFKADREGLFRWRPDGSWEAVNELPSAHLSGVIVDFGKPTAIYISGPGLGVARSDDDGKNWRTINSGLPNLEVTALARHSFQRETLYAWLQGDGIYRTEDGGANWKRVPDQGPPDKDVRGLTHSTLEGSMNTGWLYAATPTGAYLSMDCF